MSDKISIRFFGNRPVRAVWDEDNSKWWFSVLDIIAIFNTEDDYSRVRNYWKYLKNKLKKESSQLVSATNQLKLKAPDGKLRLTDVMDAASVSQLAKVMPNNKAIGFLDWFTYSENTLDGRSRKKAYDLFESGLLKKLERAASSACNKSTPIYSEVSMISLDRYGPKTSQKGVLPLPTARTSLRHCK